MDLLYWLTSSLYRRENYINVLISDLGLMTTYSLGIHKSDGLHLFLPWVDLSSKWSNQEVLSARIAKANYTGEEFESECYKRLIVGSYKTNRFQLGWLVFKTFPAVFLSELRAIDSSIA